MTDAGAVIGGGQKDISGFAGRIERAGKCRPDGGQGVELPGELVEERSAVLGESRPEARGGLDRISDLEEMGRVEAATTVGPLDPRSDVVGRADADPGSLHQQGARLVRLVQGSPDDDGLGAWLQRLREPAPGRERGVRREPLSDEGELQQPDRPTVHRQRPAADRAGLPRSMSRHGIEAHGSPA